MKHAFAALTLFASAMGLAGCDEMESGTRTEIEISEGRLVLPAVEGNPAAVYFTITYDGDGEATIDGVEVEGAQMAMMHDVEKEDGVTRMVPLKPTTLSDGASVEFAPGGKHVMAMKLDESVQSGDLVDVTLTFSDRDDLVFPVKVQAIGESE
ncbi:copper chaperone PCu(A)C [Parerythrobacter aestuarii]|uniref:copper chaperone PCu(A)C n=1 Tax=Parerythrobacter aestuarii TaxID=3020909 RepID=UPI0024DE8627|nr:copper chaperone PCu(A)C [Parerythrobacter aestuarii]